MICKCTDTKGEVYFPQDLIYSNSKELYIDFFLSELDSFHWENRLLTHKSALAKFINCWFSSILKLVKISSIYCISFEGQ